MSEKQSRTFLGRRRTVLAAVAVAAVAALAAVYEIAHRAGNDDAQCRGTARAAAGLAPLVHGEIAALALADRGRLVPDLRFSGDDGRERALSDWRGRHVLVNLWATWCAPCRYEMPALDRLQGELGGEEFEVVAISIDRGDAAAPRAFLAEAGVTRLAYYADPSTAVFRQLKAAGRAFGMPTTLLVDPDGCEIAHLAGPAEWDSEEAVTLVRAAVHGG